MFLDRLREEIQLQDQQHEDVLNVTKKHYLLGTQSYEKYKKYIHIDFFFQYLYFDAETNNLKIHQDSRVPKPIDLWIFLFRNGFSFEQKAPSGKYFVYDWQYLDWLRQLGNEHILYFFSENTMRVRSVVLTNIVMQMLAMQGQMCNIVQNIPRIGSSIGNVFKLTQTNVIEFVHIKAKVPCNILERYAIDNYMWSGDVSSVTKQPCSSLLYALFLWSSAIHAVMNKSGNNKKHKKSHIGDLTFLQWDLS